ncbi:hypothetical protein NDA18_000440 [Ustilago nuda]|nr:hypothetical protein NDA18_000440 [Ustilago nuda]
MSGSSSLRRQVSSSNLTRPVQPRSRAPPVSSSGTARRLTTNGAGSLQPASRPASSASNNDADKKRSEAGESNIQVVVRVRGQAANAPKGSSPGILSTSGPRCQQIDVAIEPPPVSSSSILASSSSLVQESWMRQKSYHFDHVFGPEADQGMVYQDVVGPILEQVMSGYNCTIFAYGQTGTGKTHTMEGDLTCQMGTYSSEAGIIPRSLYRLFHTLELSKEDYSVKATFIELYNEELRDLLGSESCANTAAEASASTQKEAQHGLRMYDDARGKGVVIQGLEEVALKDAAHGLTLLRRGSQKRQIAATNCNEQSSRSHSVFTMTVFIKDKPCRGEEVLKIGKLNLVDLAGSENIGRSGAENKRAREAGMINQSLLTLGRVINALVDKSSHIPYRESKLTRLLQESLGGPTKTCIIATVSQERANMEETLSTLDYALRAKCIKNRPELNSRITRSALIKEYVLEIERLKGDLQASRDQNGIYLTQQSWQTMHSQHEQRKTLAETLQRNAELTESKLTSLKEQFEQNMQLLLKRDNEVRIAKAECAHKVAQLQSIMARASSLELTVEEEVALRKAYMASEAHLNHAASCLAELVQQSTAHVEALFDKLHRKTAVEKANGALVAECRDAVSQRASELDATLATLHSAEAKFHASLRCSVDSLVSGTESRHEQQQQSLQAKWKKLSTSLSEVQSAEIESKDLLSALLAELHSTMNEMQATSDASLGSLKQTCRGAIEDVVLANTQRFAQVAASLDEMVQSQVATLRQAIAINAANQQMIAQAKAAAEAASAQEIARLREHNTMLTATVDDMKRSNTCLKADLMSDLGRLLDRFTHQQESAISTSISSAQALLLQSTTASQSHASQQSSHLDSLSTTAGQMASQLEQSQTALVQGSSVISHHLNQASGQLGTKMDAFASAIEEDLCISTTSATRGHQEMAQIASKARQEIQSRTKSQSAKINSTNAKLNETFDSLTCTLSTCSQEIASTAKEVVQLVGEREHEIKVWSEDMSGGLKGLCSDSTALLVNKFKHDKSTGQTPQKRAWKMPAPWNLVPTNRNDAIQAGKQVQDALLSCAPQVAASNHLVSSEIGMPQDTDTATPTPAPAPAPAPDNASIQDHPIEATAIQTATTASNSSAQPLHQIAFAHCNLAMPASTSVQDSTGMKSCSTIESGRTKDRGAKNKHSASSATALRTSKRARS